MATTDQQQFKINGLDTLNLVRQLGLFVALAASVATGVWVVLWSQEPNYSLLFGNLEETEAGLVLESLQQLNIPYKLDDSSGAILVPTKNLHDTRIKLAAQGLPKGTTGGFSNLGENDGPFGVSEAKQRIIFQRALEQELARTINSLSNVKSSRIHLAIPKRSMFVRDRQKPRASIIISLYPGRNLNDGQVSAIVHLVSSSVPNLDVDAITLVDQRGRLLTSGESNKEMAKTSSQFEYTRRVEKNKIASIERILAPILGPDAVRAQVTADVDFTYSEQTQESFNPDTPTTRSIQLTEEYSSGAAANGGIPGALSNQPPGNAEVPAVNAKSTAGGVLAGVSSRNVRKETKNFELDRTISVTRYAMGRIRRMSAAVVVDDKLSIDVSGATIRAPRSPEEMARITNLVKKAIGFNLQRGDSVNVINASFTVPAVPEALPDLSVWEQPWLWDIAKQAIGGIMVLLILFGVLRPAIKILSRTIEPVMNVPALAAPARGIDGEVADDQVTLSGAETQKKLAGPQTPFDRDMETAHTTVKQDPKLVAQVVKNWVTENG